MFNFFHSFFIMDLLEKIPDPMLAFLIRTWYKSDCFNIFFISSYRNIRSGHHWARLENGHNDITGNQNRPGKKIQIPTMQIYQVTTSETKASLQKRPDIKQVNQLRHPRVVDPRTPRLKTTSIEIHPDYETKSEKLKPIQANNLMKDPNNGHLRSH